MFTELIFSETNSESVARLAAQTKASRVAARTIRIVKLFRLIRIVKLYKSAVNANEIKEEIDKKNELKLKLKKLKEE